MQDFHNGGGGAYVAGGNDLTFTMPAYNMTLLYNSEMMMSPPMVRFDLNGGTGTIPAPASYPRNTVMNFDDSSTGTPDPAELFTPPPTVPGAVFLGWTTEIDDSTVTGNIANDGVYPMSGDGAVALDNWYFINAYDTNYDPIRRTFTIMEDTTFYAVWGYNVASTADFTKIGYSGYTGEDEDPNTAEWGTATPYTADAYYRLINNTPFTVTTPQPSLFTGVFEGNEKTVNLDITSCAPTGDAGLFSALAEGSKVRNLNLTGRIKLTKGRDVGALAGVASGDFSDNYGIMNVSSWERLATGFTPGPGFIPGNYSGFGTATTATEASGGDNDWIDGDEIPWKWYSASNGKGLPILWFSDGTEVSPWLTALP